MEQASSRKARLRAGLGHGLRFSLLALPVAGAALLLGLIGTTLRTGWIAPLDWLLPGAAAIILLQLVARRGGGTAHWRPAAWAWMLATLPAGAFCLWAGIERSWLAVAVLAAALGLVALVSGAVLRLASPARWLVLAAVLCATALAPALASAWRSMDGSRGIRPVLGVMSGLPLQGIPLGAAQGVPAAEAIGMRSPLWQGLEAGFRPRALDALDETGLQGLTALLLIQPRRLAPMELVALDGWVRGGGRLVVLADPLLHWADARPLGHPARAPLTSLLDPLLTHWGLRLEPAEMTGAGSAPERRRLAGGGMIQLLGASRFVVSENGGCGLQDDGLIARCRLGHGSAVLIADADWINDALWTLNIANPADHAGRTSDAMEVLEGWLRAMPPRLVADGVWLADHGRLLRALRIALGLLLALVVLEWLVVAIPTQFSKESGGNQGQNRNKPVTKWDFT